MAKKEDFRQITGYNGDYSVSNYSRVRNNTTGIILTPFQKDNTKNGKKFENYRVELCKGGKRTKVKVARLVAQAFVINDNPVRNTDVLHKNEELPLELINCPENLFWGNNDDNVKDRNNKGRQAKGEKSGTCVLKEEQVLQVCDYLDMGLRTIEVSKLTGISTDNIYCIKTGKTWSWLTGRGK